MTILEIVENIQERFPDISLRECLKKMSVAQREFAAVTKCLVGPYLVDVADIQYGTWVVDDNVSLVHGAVFIDVNGDVIDSDFILNVSQHVVKVYNTDGSVMLTLPSNAVALKLWATFLPDDIVESTAALSEIPVINQRFHKALFWGPLIEFGFTKNRPDIKDLAEIEFKKLVIEGKRYANLESSDIYNVEGLTHYVAATDLSVLSSPSGS